MTQIDTDKLRALHEKATPGPWDYGTGPTINDFGREFPCSLSMEWCGNYDEDCDKERYDGTLMVHLRNSVPAILAMAEDNRRLREALGTAARRLDFAAQSMGEHWGGGEIEKWASEARQALAAPGDPS